MIRDGDWPVKDKKILEIFFSFFFLTREEINSFSSMQTQRGRMRNFTQHISSFALHRTAGHVVGGFLKKKFGCKRKKECHKMSKNVPFSGKIHEETAIARTQTASWETSMIFVHEREREPDSKT